MQIQQTIHKVSTHVREQDITKFDKCPVCGDRAKNKLLGYIQRNPDVSLLKCLHCKAVSASHYPREEYLSHYYSNVFVESYQQYNENDNHQVTFSDPDRFAKHIAKYIPVYKAHGKPIHIIDFGGGDGALAIAVARRIAPDGKVNITVIDYGEGVADPRAESISICKFESLDAVVNQADIILASASLEHVPDLNPVLKSLINIQADGGYFYVRTPFIMPIKRLLSAVDFSYPAHVHDLGVDFWNRFPALFNTKYSIIRSAPSIVEVDFSTNAARYLLAYFLKLPAILEFGIYQEKKFAFWPFVGGWEALYQNNK